MVKTSGRGGPPRFMKNTHNSLPELRLFRPMSWRDRVESESLGEYISHLLLELGRLGFQIHDIERNDRPPNTETVLSDLLNWIGQYPGESFSKLVDWRALDLSQMQARLKKDRNAKPRIELSAQITKMRNLSVRWHPGGWRTSDFDFQGADRFNLITHKRWHQPPDFCLFVGDEDPTFDSRPSNELMYIRGVGNLSPEPRESYGPYAKYNSDVLDSILISAVRVAYENLAEKLKQNFEVDVLTAFDFETREEADSEPSPFKVHRVISWTLEDAAKIIARRELAAAAKQDGLDRAEFADITAVHGFTLATFIEALRASLSKQASDVSVDDQINRDTAKILRKAGFKVDVRDVRRIRQLVGRYNPDVLPESLRAALPREAGRPDNILPFPEAGIDDVGNEF